MRSFKIVFYKSESGELVKIKEFYRVVEELQDLIADPPDEFFEMLGSFFPVHGWAEMDQEKATVFVIFAPRPGDLNEVDNIEFKDWLNNVRPGDFKDFF